MFEPKRKSRPMRIGYGKDGEMEELVFDAKIKVVDLTPKHSKAIENKRVSVKFSFNGFEMWHEYTGEYAVDILRASKA